MQEGYAKYNAFEMAKFLIYLISKAVPEKRKRVFDKAVDDLIQQKTEERKKQRKKWYRFFYRVPKQEPEFSREQAIEILKNDGDDYVLSTYGSCSILHNKTVELAKKVCNLCLTCEDDFIYLDAPTVLAFCQWGLILKKERENKLYQYLQDGGFDNIIKEMVACEKEYEQRKTKLKGDYYDAHGNVFVD